MAATNADGDLRSLLVTNAWSARQQLGKPGCEEKVCVIRQKIDEFAPVGHSLLPVQPVATSPAADSTSDKGSHHLTFSILPQAHLRAPYITISPTVLRDILRKVPGYTRFHTGTNLPENQEMFKAVFDIRRVKTASSTKQLECSISTDGIGASVLMGKPRSEEGIRRIDVEKAEKKARVEKASKASPSKSGESCLPRVDANDSHLPASSFLTSHHCLGALNLLCAHRLLRFSTFAR